MINDSEDTQKIVNASENIQQGRQCSNYDLSQRGAQYDCAKFSVEELPYFLLKDFIFN